MLNSFYLTFSDGAKFADIARNIVRGNGYNSNFNFWGATNSNSIQPLMPYSIALFFKLFGTSDLSVIATSLFYFILILIFVFLLSKKIFEKLFIAILSTIAVGFNYDLIHYATSGATETPFIFEIIASLYFISLKKKWSYLVAVLLLVLMYLTRPQAIIYILGLIVYFLFLNFKWQKATLYSVASFLFGSLFYLLYSRQGAIAITQNLPGIAVSDSLRGAYQSSGILTLIKKVFYNLYNFYKLLPQIINPYLFTLFLIGLFRSPKNKLQNSINILAIYMVCATFFVTALTIPFFRYLHPTIPLVYILAVGTLIQILNSQFLIFTAEGTKSQLSIYNFKLSQRIIIILTSLFIILFMGVGQTIGVLFLDSRFEAKNHNLGKPPVYVVLSRILKENTYPYQLIITNLDTWGSWYGERKTAWFPLEPKQLTDSSSSKIPFDAIYLTSYLIDDQNYYMGESWRSIFDNPKDTTKWTCDGCEKISKEFKLKGIYKINANEVYENSDAMGILLTK